MRRPPRVVTPRTQANDAGTYPLRTTAKGIQ